MVGTIPGEPPFVTGISTVKPDAANSLLKRQGADLQRQTCEGWIHLVQFCGLLNLSMSAPVVQRDYIYIYIILYIVYNMFILYYKLTHTCHIYTYIIIKSVYNNDLNFTDRPPEPPNLLPCP